jgi:lipopolysaccharide export LptBFGC system permease protein LptF
MFAKYKQNRATALRMRQLRQEIDNIYEYELRGAKTPAERQVAYDIINEQVKYQENEFEHLRQSDLLAKLSKEALTIPAEHYEDYGASLKTTLTYAGEMWARRELKKLRREEIEFWAKLVLPVVALVVSIIALVKKH